ncbi:hypothetical protein DKX38_007508 [Salix brachista]|uniref:Uncharacterized protein n=1 Tax=Salix brachista TaxID=2182728 RepID=A0A5N5MNF3_9ROSI|nr:hypothetical protein DKX38_007508 [Salix brachista]
MLLRYRSHPISENNGSRVSYVCLGGDIGRVGSFAAEGIRATWGLKGQLQNVNESRAVLQHAGKMKVNDESTIPTWVIILKMFWTSLIMRMNAADCEEAGKENTVLDDAWDEDQKKFKKIL